MTDLIHGFLCRLGTEKPYYHRYPLLPAILVEYEEGGAVHRNGFEQVAAGEHVELHELIKTVGNCGVQSTVLMYNGFSGGVYRELFSGLQQVDHGKYRKKSCSDGPDLSLRGEKKV